MELSESERFDWYANKIGSHMHHDHIIQEMNENRVPTKSISLIFNKTSTEVKNELPLDLVSYGILLSILAKTVNMVSDELIGNLGECYGDKKFNIDSAFVNCGIYSS